MKKVLIAIVNTLSVVIIVFAVLVLLTVATTRGGEAPSFLGYSVFHVLTGSMEPAIPTDSLILVHRTEPESIAVGDVITFYSRDPELGGAMNTHRVAAIARESDGSLVFTTAGDANYVPDEYPTYARDVVGVVVFSSFALGKLVRLLSNPLVFFPFLIVPLVVLVIVNLLGTIRTARKLALEEEAKALEEALAEAERRRAAQGADAPPAAEKPENTEKDT